MKLKSTPNIIMIIVGFAVLFVCGLGLSAVSTTISQWSPEHQAKATLMLRTPTPPPTVNPDVQDEIDDQLKDTIETGGAVARGAAIVAGVAAGIIALSIAGVFVSMAWRHTRRTRDDKKVTGLDRDGIQIVPIGKEWRVVDGRTGSNEDLAQDRAPSLPQAQLFALAEVQRLAVEAVVTTMDRAPRDERGDWIKVLRWLGQLNEHTLLPSGKSEVQE